eukprot:CFRG8585T1
MNKMSRYEDEHEHETYGCSYNRSPKIRLQRKLTTGSVVGSMDALRQLEAHPRSMSLNVWQSLHTEDAKESTRTVTKDESSINAKFPSGIFLSRSDPILPDASKGMELPKSTHYMPFNRGMDGDAMWKNSPIRRCHFIVERWIPFLEELNAFKRLAEQRVKADYQIGSRFPVHGHDLPTLAQQCYELTEEWSIIGLSECPR